MNMYQKREERKKKRLEAEGQDNIRPSISISWVVGIYGRTALNPVFIRV